MGALLQWKVWSPDGFQRGRPPGGGLLPNNNVYVLDHITFGHCVRGPWLMNPSWCGDAAFIKEHLIPICVVNINLMTIILCTASEGMKSPLYEYMIV